MSRYYILGPMTGYEEFNAPAFRHAADQVRALGHDVLSPVEFDEAEGFDHAAGEIQEGTYVTFLRRDLLRILEADVDGAVALSGWEQSRGAALEVRVLQGLGKPIYKLDNGELVPATPPRHPASERFHRILRDLGHLHDRKQADYGRDDDPFANVRASNEWGVPEWVGAMVRATDKVRRLQTYARRGSLANEGVEDAFMDLAVYAVIALVLWDEEANGTTSA